MRCLRESTKVLRNCERFEIGRGIRLENITKEGACVLRGIYLYMPNFGDRGSPYGNVDLTLEGFLSMADGSSKVTSW